MTWKIDVFARPELLGVEFSRGSKPVLVAADPAAGVAVNGAKGANRQAR
jgi:hypothetical protein